MFVALAKDRKYETEYVIGVSLDSPSLEKQLTKSRIHDIIAFKQESFPFFLMEIYEELHYPGTNKSRFAGKNTFVAFDFDSLCKFLAQIPKINEMMDLSGPAEFKFVNFKIDGNEYAMLEGESACTIYPFASDYFSKKPVEDEMGCLHHVHFSAWEQFRLRALGPQFMWDMLMVKNFTHKMRAKRWKFLQDLAQYRRLAKIAELGKLSPKAMKKLTLFKKRQKSVAGSLHFAPGLEPKLI